MNRTILIAIFGLVTIMGGLFLLHANSVDKPNQLIQVEKELQNPSTNGFYLVNMLSQFDEDHLEAQLMWVPDSDFIDDPKNPVIQQLLLILTIDNYNELQLKITDIKNQRFTLPYQEPFPFTKAKRDPTKQNLFAYTISVPGESFFFKLWRKDTGEILFDTTNSPLTFQDKYLQISNNLSNSALFGLGERRTSFKLNSGRYSVWAADAARIDYGYPGQQIYGTHPMYLRRDAYSHNFHVVFLRNAYGMLIDYQENNKITYQVIGGNFDFKFFIGDTNPEVSIKLYHNYINGWILHPFWVQGYHQCRWGYKTSQALEDVWNKFNELSIPIDSLWSDIDYMFEFYDFSVDTTNFDLEQMKQIYNKSSPYGVHWSSIIDVGIALPSDAATRGQELNTFIKSGITGKDLIGSVWPGETYYPDFNHPNSTQFWYEGLTNITKNYGLDQEGIWIDMNEFSNFVNGEVLPPSTNSINKFLGTNESVVQKTGSILPFNPIGEFLSLQDIYTYNFLLKGSNDIEEKTLSLNAIHYNKKDAQMLYIKNYNLTQYDMHNLNGFGESIATYKAAKMMGRQLTFILSRSTLFGSGKYVQHWNGDGFSQWDYLAYTIPGIMNFQLYSIPFVGDDICGLNDNATPELCARWMQLGSLYPFSRNHNGNESISQEPYAFPTYEYVLTSSIKTLNVRYQLLKFYYHLFVEQNGLGTIFRPLMWAFPHDDAALSQETQFMLGDYLMAAPVTYPGNQASNTTELSIYFPQSGVFYDFYDQTRHTQGSLSLQIPFDSVVPLYVKAGKIVHLQDQSNVLRSKFLDNHFTLYIALDDNLMASGTMLTINDYNNDENIIQNCLEGANCVTRLDVVGSYKDKHNFNIHIQNIGQNDDTIFQEIYIDKLIIAGIPNFNNYISATIDISSNPFVITRTNQSYSIMYSL